ncbi:MAG: hypothetical protein CL532_01225 [Aestuariivita sp.]|nr:hypothetical protein [Aestuariivita sp.]|tara:strand:+ start:506 stop:721 length:216 start_codon:yes stop_codon:yes gene_type:complete
MYEVYDKRHCKVLGQARTKDEAKELAIKATTLSSPKHQIADLKIRTPLEPPIKVFYETPSWEPTKKPPTVA